MTNGNVLTFVLEYSRILKNNVSLVLVVVISEPITNTCMSVARTISRVQMVNAILNEQPARRMHVRVRERVDVARLR